MHCLRLLATVWAAAATLAGASATAAEPIVIGLITKNDTNPYFLKMREGALLGATVHGVKLITAAGTSDSDTATQSEALRRMVAEGARTILIAPSGAGVVPAIEEARAKGTLIIALDSPTQPVDAIDALFATNNYQAGLLTGQYAKAAMPLRFPGQPLKIAMLDYVPDHPVSTQRHNGFMVGLGLKADGAESLDHSTAPEILCADFSLAETPKGRSVMEACLRQHPDINLVYTINEPAAAGAYEALKALGKEKQAVIVSFDGGCPGIRMVESGVIAASSQQFPLQMAAMGVDAGVAYARHGTKVKGYVDTGVALITAAPMTGVPSKPVSEALQTCFGKK